MSIGIIESRRAGWTFWLGWMLASIGGAIVFLIVVFPLNLLFMQIVPEPNTADSLALSVVFTAISSGVMGALFGLAQWLVLRRVLPAMERWVLATPIGYGLVFGAIPIIRFDAIPQLGGAMMFLVFGIVLGILQWLVLRERVYRAGWWIAISTAGWAIAFIFIGAAYLSGLYIEPFDLIAAFLVPTGVTGAGMVWLLQRTARAEPLGNPETMTLSEQPPGSRDA